MKASKYATSDGLLSSSEFAAVCQLGRVFSRFFAGNLCEEFEAAVYVKGDESRGIRQVESEIWGLGR